MYTLYSGEPRKSLLMKRVDAYKCGNADATTGE